MLRCALNGTGNSLNGGVTEKLCLVDRLEVLNLCIQKQLMSLECGYVRVIVGAEMYKNEENELCKL